MDQQVFIFDTTLRDGEQVPGCKLNTKEKVELALKWLPVLVFGINELRCPTVQLMPYFNWSSRWKGPKNGILSST